MAPAEVTIRLAGLPDHEVLVGLWLDLVADQRQHGTTLSSEANEVAVRAWFAEQLPRNNVLVASVDHDVVGFVAFGFMQDRFARDTREGIVHTLFVAAESRGRGIGSALLDAAEDALGQRGVDGIRLELLAGNERAARFYDDHGYDPHRIVYRKPLRNTDSDAGPGDT